MPTIDVHPDVCEAISAMPTLFPIPPTTHQEMMGEASSTEPEETKRHKRAKVAAIVDICPSCSFEKTLGSCIGINGVRLAVAMEKKFIYIFRAAKIDISDPSLRIKVCFSCSRHCKEAIKAVISKTENLFNLPTPSSRKALVFENGTVFAVPGPDNGKLTMVSCIASVCLFLMFINDILAC